nr:endonuclease MutS2 [Chroococcidiopsis sp. SAG 2025]
MIQSETLELLEWSRLCQHLATFTATKLGAIAARNLVIPDTQAKSQELLNQTKEVYELDSRLSAGLSFAGIQDIGESLERAELQGILTAEQLLAIATTLTGTRQLRRSIDQQQDLPVLQELVSTVKTDPELEQDILYCIDEQGKVADRASLKLAEIRDRVRQLRQRITQTLQGILQRQANAVQEQLITQRGDRFVIPVKAPQKDAIPGIVHDASMSGATLYVEPNAIVALGNQLRQYIAREQAEEEAIRRRLTEQVAAVKPDLENLLAVVTIIDLASARARYSYWLQANPPRFCDRSQGENTTLRQLRHPLLVWQNQHEQGQPVIPVDIIVQPHIRVITITGPNTGGKTVTLKTLGLAALMAKVGLFIPAKEPVEIPWFDMVLADIGDEQSLQQSLSTFSGHIRRISRILEAIGGVRSEERGAREFEDIGGVRSEERGVGEFEDKGEKSSSGVEEAEGDKGDKEDKEDKEEVQSKIQNPKSKIQNSPHSSLVLLDEVGAGTDPVEGSALAIALLRHLADNAELSMATTHFGELKALKYQDERFENASVEFNEETLSPTYRLLWGIPGRSNALAIAARLGLKPEVIEQAKHQVGEATEDVNQVIAGLEAQRRQQETKAAQAQQLLQQTERLYRQLSERTAQLDARERELRASQEQAIQQAIAQAKAEIAQVIRKLQQGTPTAQAAQQATVAIDRLAQQHTPPTPKPKTEFRPQVGNRIRIPRLGQTAEVLNEPNDDGELIVRFGLMKMTVKLEDIESLDGKKATFQEKGQGRHGGQGRQGRQGGQGSRGAEGQGSRGEKQSDSRLPTLDSPTIRTSQNTFDIRGSRVADAEIVLDKAIAEASGTIWIIHGHGTGKLRQGVHNFLQQHSMVSSFEAAAPEDGGSGVTVVFLR